MTLARDAKFEEKLTSDLENDISNLANFQYSTRNSQNWDFPLILSSKVENVWALNLQEGFVSWQWRMMQNLMRNWLVNSKLTWGIWRVLTQAIENLKNLPFNRLLLTKVYNVWAKTKYRRVMFDDTEYWGNIWKKTELCFQKWNEEFSKFLPEHLWKPKIWGLWWDPFIQSRKCMTLKFTGEFCLITIKNNAKFEEELNCPFKIDMRNLTILTRALTNLKNLYFNGASFEQSICLSYK